MNWRNYKPPTKQIGRPDRRSYQAKVDDVIVGIMPRFMMGSGPWGHGRKRTKIVGYDVIVAGVKIGYAFGTAKLAKQFAEEYMAAKTPQERYAVKKEWDA